MWGHPIPPDTISCRFFRPHSCSRRRRHHRHRHRGRRLRRLSCRRLYNELLDFKRRDLKEVEPLKW